MKRTFNLLIILSLPAQICRAQEIETEEEYAAFCDSIAPRLKQVEKEANCYSGKPFGELVKCLDKNGVKIIKTGMEYDSRQLYPQEVYGLRIYFDDEAYFASKHKLNRPLIRIYFVEGKPYKKALDLTGKHKGYFTEEMEEFYSDAIIRSIEFLYMDDAGRPY